MSVWSLRGKPTAKHPKVGTPGTDVVFDCSTSTQSTSGIASALFNVSARQLTPVLHCRPLSQRRNGGSFLTFESRTLCTHLNQHHNIRPRRTNPQLKIPRDRILTPRGHRRPTVLPPGHELGCNLQTPSLPHRDTHPNWGFAPLPGRVDVSDSCLNSHPASAACPLLRRGQRGEPERGFVPHSAFLHRILHHS